MDSHPRRDTSVEIDSLSPPTGLEELQRQMQEVTRLLADVLTRLITLETLVESSQVAANPAER